jgi:hypothetical protein
MSPNSKNGSKSNMEVVFFLPSGEFMHKLSISVPDDIMEKLEKSSNKSADISGWLRHYFTKIELDQNIEDTIEFRDAVNAEVLKRGEKYRKYMINHVKDFPKMMQAILAYEADSGRLWNPITGDFMSVMLYLEKIIKGEL